MIKLIYVFLVLGISVIGSAQEPLLKKLARTKAIFGQMEGKQLQISYMFGQHQSYMGDPAEDPRVVKELYYLDFSKFVMHDLLMASEVQGTPSPRVVFILFKEGSITRHTEQTAPGHGEELDNRVQEIKKLKASHADLFRNVEIIEFQQATNTFGFDHHRNIGGPVTFVEDLPGEVNFRFNFLDLTSHTVYQFLQIGILGKVLGLGQRMGLLFRDGVYHLRNFAQVFALGVFKQLPDLFPAEMSLEVMMGSRVKMEQRKGSGLGPAQMAGGVKVQPARTMTFEAYIQSDVAKLKDVHDRPRGRGQGDMRESTNYGRMGDLIIALHNGERLPMATGVRPSEMDHSEVDRTLLKRLLNFRRGQLIRELSLLKQELRQGPQVPEYQLFEPDEWERKQERHARQVERDMDVVNRERGALTIEYQTLLALEPDKLTRVVLYELGSVLKELDEYSKQSAGVGKEVRAKIQDMAGLIKESDTTSWGDNLRRLERYQFPHRPQWEGRELVELVGEVKELSGKVRVKRPRR